MASTNTMPCAQCGKKRKGRFLRHALPGAAPGSPLLPRYICTVCVPEGKGQAEAPAEPVTAIAVVIPKPPSPEERETIIGPLVTEVTGLQVRSAEEYTSADQLLGRIIKARSSWGERMEKIIRPIRTGLDELYKLNRDVDKPLGELESAVKKEMKAFKEIELKAIREADAKRQEEVNRLERERVAQQAALEKARTPQMKAKAIVAQRQIEEQMVEVASEPTPEPVQGMSSSTRVPKKWRLKDPAAFWDLVGAVMEGKADPDCIMLNEKHINAIFRTRPDLVESWPGIEIYDDVQIVGRG